MTEYSSQRVTEGNYQRKILNEVYLLEGCDRRKIIAKHLNAKFILFSLAVLLTEYNNYHHAIVTIFISFILYAFLKLEFFYEKKLFLFPHLFVYFHAIIYKNMYYLIKLVIR